MAKKINKIDFLENLSWDDQKEWAGSKIVSPRAKSYLRGPKPKI